MKVLIIIYNPTNSYFDYLFIHLTKKLLPNKPCGVSFNLFLVVFCHLRLRGILMLKSKGLGLQISRVPWHADMKGFLFFFNFQHLISTRKQLTEFVFFFISFHKRKLYSCDNKQSYIMRINRVRFVNISNM